MCAFPSSSAFHWEQFGKCLGQHILQEFQNHEWSNYKWEGERKRKRNTHTHINIFALTYVKEFTVSWFCYSEIQDLLPKLFITYRRNREEQKKKIEQQSRLHTASKVVFGRSITSETPWDRSAADANWHSIFDFRETKRNPCPRPCSIATFLVPEGLAPFFLRYMKPVLCGLSNLPGQTVKQQALIILHGIMYSCICIKKLCNARAIATVWSCLCC